MAGLSLDVELVVVIEEIARVCPLGSCQSDRFQLGLWLADFANFGSDAIKGQLPPSLLAEGALLGSFAVTEAGAGSDAAAMDTTRRQGPRRQLDIERNQGLDHQRR